jgi:hypothetical protein
MQNKFSVSNLINSTGFDLQVSGDQGPIPLCLRRLEVRAQFGLRRVFGSAFRFGTLVANILKLFRSFEKPSLAGLPFFVGH